VDRSEDRKVGRSEDRRVGRSEDRRVGRSEDRKVGRSEDRKVGRSEDQRVGRSEDRKVGRLEGHWVQPLPALMEGAAASTPLKRVRGVRAQPLARDSRRASKHSTTGLMMEVWTRLLELMEA
jgi:hypothetical protein